MKRSGSDSHAERRRRRGLGAVRGAYRHGPQVFARGGIEATGDRIHSDLMMFAATPLGGLGGAPEHDPGDQRMVAQRTVRRPRATDAFGGTSRSSFSGRVR